MCIRDSVRTVKGVKRPALATCMPGKKQPFLLLDCGANAECRAEMLNAFGTMGSVYMNKVMGRKGPAVALVNNGAEDTKGTPMYREAHGLLKANPAIRFVGNIEPRDIMAGEGDVIVCDGFVGNVVLKLTEGVAGTLLGMLKDIFMQSIVTKLCYLGVKSGLRNLKHMMDSEVPARPRASRTPSARQSCALPMTCAAPCRAPWPKWPPRPQQKRQTRNKTAYRAKIEMLCPPIGNGRYQNIGSGRTMCAPTG